MKLRRCFITVMILFFIEIIGLNVFSCEKSDNSLDTVEVNYILHSIQENWHDLNSKELDTSLDYVIFDMDGEVLYATKQDIIKNINQAIAHQDTIINIEDNKKIVGNLVIYNRSTDIFLKEKNKIIFIMAILLLMQCLTLCGYLIYLNRVVIHPFYELKDFASRIANGNLDVPLNMDKNNLFGAFTESFDIMRSELKQARMDEARANASKKELAAKLSHDIKTPIASIKAVAEVGIAVTDNEKIQLNYYQIIKKADQINTLVSNLFSATLEELQQLEIQLSDNDSTMLPELLHQADYLTYAEIPEVPECLLYFDKLRLLQVFDNLFSNSYKYANTKIRISFQKEELFLSVIIEDYGEGVLEEELPLLTEKFKRGENAKNKDGAGLGLYISDYFMKEMKGELCFKNTEEGFAAIVRIRLSGIEI